MGKIASEKAPTITLLLKTKVIRNNPEIEPEQSKTKFRVAIVEDDEEIVI